MEDSTYKPVDQKFLRTANDGPIPWRRHLIRPERGTYQRGLNAIESIHDQLNRIGTEYTDPKLSLRDKVMKDSATDAWVRKVFPTTTRDTTMPYDPFRAQKLDVLATENKTLVNQLKLMYNKMMYEGRVKPPVATQLELPFGGGGADFTSPLSTGLRRHNLR